MRKVVVRTTLLLASLIAIALVWIWHGRELALLSEQFTIAIRSEPVKSLSYEGGGKGGILHVNDLALDLTPAKSSDPIPEIGTTKDGQMALSYAGKVFSFGALTGADSLVTAPATGDEASIELRHSAVAWPNPFEMNFMTEKSPSWKRLRYQRLIWKKSGGVKLEIMWRCEQYFYPKDGWTDACMTAPALTGLIRVEILNPAR